MSANEAHADGDEENASHPEPDRIGGASGSLPQVQDDIDGGSTETAEPTKSATSAGEVLPDADIFPAPAALDFLLAAAVENTINLNSLAEQRRRNRLTTEHQRLTKLVREQSERRDNAAAKLAEAQEKILQAIRDKLNAEVAVGSYTEQIGNAARHKSELETELQMVNDELKDLARTPQERAAYRTRRENAARKAAEAARARGLVGRIGSGRAAIHAHRAGPI
jgi:hypothetical protein